MAQYTRAVYQRILDLVTSVFVAPMLTQAASVSDSVNAIHNKQTIANSCAACGFWNVDTMVA